MSLFDRKPDLRKNSFTLEEAADLFREVAQDMDDQNIPAEVLATVLKLAEIAALILRAV